MKFPRPPKKAAVIATGWIGDSIACTAAASSLSEKGYRVTLFIRWPQLSKILANDSRFSIVNYRYLSLIKFIKPILRWWFDMVVWEPDKWSYQEPFTAEIRRRAGCKPEVAYELFVNPQQRFERYQRPLNQIQRPIISIGRDIFKRAYGRDVADLVRSLSEFADIVWVGLDASKNSKHGKGRNLLIDATIISETNIFIGPEGGLLWLAAGIGVPCVYFSENINHVAQMHGFIDLDKVLGSKNCFPDVDLHEALPPFCSNEFAVSKIKKRILV